MNKTNKYIFKQNKVLLKLLIRKCRKNNNEIMKCIKQIVDKLNAEFIGFRYDALTYKEKFYYDRNIIFSYEDVQKLTFIVNLGKDIVLTFPWKNDRMESAMKIIGSDVNNPFKEIQNKHTIIAFSPIKFYTIENGNHSIACGILKKEGLVHSEYCYDMCSKYNIWKFDGNYFINKENKAKIKSKTFEFGLFLELGRLLVKK